MNNEKHIHEAAKVAGHSTTTITKALKWPLVVGIAILMILSIAACYYGAYSDMYAHFNNAFLSGTFAASISVLSEAVAGYFFFIAFSALVSYNVNKSDKNLLRIGIVTLAVAMAAYYGITYRYTSKGFVTVAANTDESDKINLTYSLKTDSIYKAYGTIIDSISRENKANYVKFDSLSGAGIVGLAVKNLNNRINRNASLITQYEAQKVDIIGDLQTERQKELLSNSEKLTAQQGNNFNLALITLFGTPLLIGLYCYFMMLVRKQEGKGIIEQLLDENESLKKKASNSGSVLNQNRKIGTGFGSNLN